MSHFTAEEKLVALGLRSPGTQTNPYRGLFDQLASATPYATFRTSVAGLGTFDAFETSLTDDLDFSAEDATRFRVLMEQTYETMAAFQSALADVESYAAWEATFALGTTLGTTPEDGAPTNAGVRVHAAPGVSFEGEPVERGTVEVFGPRIEFSETVAGAVTDPAFTYTNLSVSDPTPVVGETVTISCDVTNQTAATFSPLVRLLEDGKVVDTIPTTVPGGGTVTVEFTRSWTDYVSVDLRVETSASVTVSVIPTGLEGLE